MRFGGVGVVSVSGKRDGQGADEMKQEVVDCKREEANGNSRKIYATAKGMTSPRSVLSTSSLHVSEHGEGQRGSR